MADKVQDPAEGEKPQDAGAEAVPQDPETAEGGTPQDAGEGEGGKQGQPNVHKLERDVANRDKV